MTLVLSRSADHLYWMARQVERAENTARILDVSERLALIPLEQGKAGGKGGEWDAVLQITGGAEEFHQRFGDPSAEAVISYLTLDPENPSSIYSTIRAARENARAERVALTTEMWEALNSTWLEISTLTPARLASRGHRNFFDWIKERSHLFRGVAVSTMLRDERYHFLRLGTFIERADNTARILDVKYHILLPHGVEVGSAVDYMQWGALLRSVSAYRTYHHAYKETIAPAHVAELLIFDISFPRSLHACVNEVLELLNAIGGPRGNEAQRLAGELHARLHYGKIESVFAQGLHEFITDFIARNNALSNEIQAAYLIAE
ncbi:MAG: alpha-E domain-containing protein [Alphaproteobacteria bacterium]|nr:alpha-E domain-containing protein [Alphaproteobacteria bacterium]